MDLMETTSYNKVPTSLNVDVDIDKCFIRNNYLVLIDKLGRSYRLRDEKNNTITKLIKGEIKILYPRVYYGNWHVFETSKKKKIMKHEKECEICNGTGHLYLGCQICLACDGKGKLNWIQDVFKKIKERFI